jgi:argininosuccinate synthase
MSAKLEAILKKVNETPVKTGQKIALAYSGGLDSSLAIELLKRVYKAKEVITIHVDIGQGDDEINEAMYKAKLLGVKPVIISAKEEFAQMWLKKAIWANVSYNGYPASTSMTRQLIAKMIACEAQKLGCDALMEGSTGKGNDQYRFHNVTKLFAPKLELLVPVRDFDLSRDEELALCEHWGVPVQEIISGGDDKTLWGRSIASGAIALNQKIPDDLWLWKKPLEQTPNTPEQVTITFENGAPVALNHKVMPLDQIIETLNTLGGNHGIGLIDMCEDGIMNLKSREIYEAPAAQIILKLHQDLEQFCLTKEEIQFKKGIDSQWSYLVYHGMWYHPLKSALDAFVAQTQNVVSGTYVVKLFKGNCEIIDRQIPKSLFFPDVRSINSTNFNQLWCKDAATIQGLPFELLARRNATISDMAAGV